MFILSVQDILGSFTGDARSLSFEAPIPKSTFSAFECLTPLVFELRLTTEEDSITATFLHLYVRVRFASQTVEVDLHDIDRIFKPRILPSDPDDIRPIDMRNQTIDLLPVLEEEITIFCHAQSL